MTKTSCKIILLVIIVLFCTAFIFSNSLKNSEESHADSDVIVEIVKKIVNKVAPDNDWDWNYIVRKCAHIFEFFVLGAFATWLCLETDKKYLLVMAFVLLYAMLIALSDEFIQRFTGRTSSLTDVIIDMTGAIAGVCFVLIICFMSRRLRTCSRKNFHNDSIQENVK